MQTVYMRRARSLSFEHMVIIRKWLLKCYADCQASGDQDSINELQEVGREVRRIIDFIQEQKTQIPPAEYVVW